MAPRSWLLESIALLLFTPLLAAQPQTSRSVPLQTLRADVDMVMVPIVVTDRHGTVVTGLDASRFSVRENRVPRPIAAFSKEEEPCSVGIVLDLSGSMRGKLQDATAAVRAFLAGFNTEDETFLMAVSSRPESLLDFTGDAATLQNRLIAVRAEGSTALVDTVFLALNRMRAARNPRKSLIIVSDGIDNHSRYSKAELLRVVQEQDVAIHTIGIAERPAGRKPIELTEESRGLELMTDLAARSGGLNFTVVNAQDIQPAAVKIGRAIREQYLLAYRPAGERASGQWQSIEVKVAGPQFRAYARKGYYY